MAVIRNLSVSVVFICLLAVAGRATAQGFVDVAGARGLSIMGASTFTNMDRGVCWGDFDGDGDQDLVATGVPTQPILYFRNVGGGSFVDATGGAGLGWTTWARACAAADVDNDGDLDLYVTHTWAPNQLFVNDGTGVFTEQGALAGVDDSDNGFAATFGDFDRDGWVDLYLGNHSTFQGVPQTNVLYRNDGDGTFTNVTASAGVADPGGPTFAAAWHDYDEDGWPDLFVANDWHAIAGFSKNTTYRNNGDGTFTNVGSQIHTDLGIQSMGIDYADVFNDGGWDIYVSNLESGHVFHEWDPGQQLYVERAQALGIQANQLGWAVHFFDYDNDGWQDLYANHSENLGAPGVNTLFRNPGPGTPWSDVAGAVGLDAPGRYFTSAIADIDDDGRMDILQLRNAGPARLFLNQVAAGNWIKLELVGTVSNRSAIGAVAAVTVGGVVRRQTVRTGTGFMSGSDLRLNFGLGAATAAERVDVRWPSGQIQTLVNVPSNQVLTIREPALSLDAPAATGTAPNLILGSSGDAGLPYLIALALTSSPGIPLGDGRIVPLTPDALTWYALAPGNPTVPAPHGILDGQGSGVCPLVIPPYPALGGASIFASAITLDPAASAGIRNVISPATRITFQ